jgi:hypothetical protein
VSPFALGLLDVAACGGGCSTPIDWSNMGITALPPNPLAACGVGIPGLQSRFLGLHEHL